MASQARQARTWLRGLLAYFSPVLPQMVLWMTSCRQIGFIAEESTRADLVDHATTNTTAVDHYPVSMVLVVDADDFACELGVEYPL